MNDSDDKVAASKVAQVAGIVIGVLFAVFFVVIILGLIRHTYLWAFS